MPKPKVVNVHEAKTHFSKLLQGLEQGESYVIARAGKAIGRLIPFSPPKKKRIPGGSWKGKVKMAADFDALPQEIEDAFYGDDE